MMYAYEHLDVLPLFGAFFITGTLGPDSYLSK